MKGSILTTVRYISNWRGPACRCHTETPCRCHGATSVMQVNGVKEIVGEKLLRVSQELFITDIMDMA